MQRLDPAFGVPFSSNASVTSVADEAYSGTVNVSHGVARRSRRDGKTVYDRADKDGMARALEDLQAHLKVRC